MTGTRLIKIILVLLVLVNVADVITTNHVLLHANAVEANPIARILMYYLGALWWMPKALLSVFFLYYIVMAQSSKYLSVALTILVVYVAIVANNLLNF